MRVAVLGGGLQGACVALELAANGIQVDLFDRGDRCFERASLHNEGKIHLGYVYANDPTRQTARLMARGAVCFQALMRRWIGDAIDRVPVSAPFFYVVHRESLLGIDQIEEHFADTQRILLEESNGHGIEYFGSDYREGPARLSDDECARHFDPRAVQAAYRTAEIAIDSEVLGSAVCERLSCEKSDLQSIAKRGSRGDTNGTARSQSRMKHAAMVLNGNTITSSTHSGMVASRLTSLQACPRHGPGSCGRNISCVCAPRGTARPCRRRRFCSDRLATLSATPTTKLF